MLLQRGGRDQGGARRRSANGGARFVGGLPQRGHRQLPLPPQESVVGVHDLLAHVAGVDYKMGLVGLNSQFALVEVAAPVVHLAGGVLTLVALISFQIQMGRTLHRCETGRSIQMLATHSIYAPRTASII